LPWIIVFVYSWVLFFIFVDRKKLGRSVYGGLIALTAGSVVDGAAHFLDLYHFDHTMPEIVSYMFHGFGPLFTMGTLFFQVLIPDRKMQLANVAAFSAAYLAVEYLIVASGGARYIHWNLPLSLVVNVAVFTAMSYLGEIIMFKKVSLTRRGPL